MKLLYRHADGRLIEISGDTSQGEVWQLYPHRELLETTESFDEGKEKLPDGFEQEANSFEPPCPKCEKPSPLCLETGMYLRKDCDDPRCGCPF
ncbi:MAG: hypothetical protein JKY65_34265 [Planctomycetes bacterium]|nr:hypothetical protein [Planctomycetota bacterium]